MGEKHPQFCSGLFRHQEAIIEAYRHIGGTAWYHYDESFRQKLSVYPGVKWWQKDVGLWLNLMIPQKSFLAKNTGQTLFRKGVCFSFNGPIIAGTDPSAPTAQVPTQDISVLENSHHRPPKNLYKRARTPVNLIRLLPWLGLSPDHHKAQVLYNGFKVGFYVPPFDGTGCLWVENSKSVLFKKEVVCAKIQSEIDEGRIAGPFNSPLFVLPFFSP